MAFRDKMRVAVSNAELQLDIELQNRKLLRHCHSKDSTIVFLGNGKYKIVPKERLTFEIVNKSKGFTIPDRIVHNMPVYLDGEPHLKFGVKSRDDRIDKMLHSCGLQPYRFSYRGRLSKQRLNEIVNEIEEKVKI